MMGFKTIWLLLLLHLNVIVYAKDSNNINFIKSFIKNEQKPTNVIYRNLCWKICKYRINEKSFLHYKENFRALIYTPVHAKPFAFSFLVRG